MPLRHSLISLALSATAATAQVTPAPITRSLWTSTVAPGHTDYQTGTFDQPADGGIRLTCLPGGKAILLVQIKGVAPTAGARIRLIANTRRTSQSVDYTAGPDGLASYRATSPQFRRLWTMLRGGGTVTIRYPDNGFSVQSLVGAARTLPVRPCR